MFSFSAFLLAAVAISLAVNPRAFSVFFILCHFFFSYRVRVLNEDQRCSLFFPSRGLKSSVCSKDLLIKPCSFIAAQPISGVNNAVKDGEDVLLFRRAWPGLYLLGRRCPVALLNDRALDPPGRMKKRPWNRRPYIPKRTEIMTTGQAVTLKNVTLTFIEFLISP